MSTLLRKLRAAPWIAFYRLRAPSRRDYARQWSSYWSSVERTGTGGEVLWDSEEAEEAAEAITYLEAHADPMLPLLDLGCGSGRRTAALARRFGHVVGVDVAAEAVGLARREWAAVDGLSFEVLDVVDTEAVAALAARLGPMNVHARGVLHLIVDADRPRLLENLAILLGDRGVLYFSETDGGALDYFLGQPGDSPSGLPSGMHKVVEHGILPHGFGATDHARWFDPARWQTLAKGEARIYTVPFANGKPGRVPAFFGVVRALPA